MDEKNVNENLIIENVTIDEKKEALRKKLFMAESLRIPQKLVMFYIDYCIENNIDVENTSIYDRTALSEEVVIFVKSKNNFYSFIFNHLSEKVTVEYVKR